MQEAFLYEKSEEKTVKCFLCNHYCAIEEQKFGFCGVRQNIGGKLYTHAYGRVIAANVDPIEKKPLYHFLPGSTSFSIATVGCNFRCGFCQNWEISQVSAKDGLTSWGSAYSADEIVNSALKKHCKSISYTYTEPTIFFEYAWHIAKKAHEKGLRNVFVTNGYMTAQAIKMISPYLSAANIDLKFFSEDSYRKFCAGSLKAVLESIELMHKLKIWVEITTLIVPTKNDSPDELKKAAGFIAGLDKNIPWHLSRFYPNYKDRDLEPTHEVVLKQARDLGFQAGLKYVYVGNVYGWGNDTICPKCKKILLKREVFNVLENNIKQGKCAFCNEVIAGHF